MKRAIALLLGIVLLFACAGCGANGDAKAAAADYYQLLSNFYFVHQQAGEELEEIYLLIPDLCAIADRDLVEMAALEDIAEVEAVVETMDKMVAREFAKLENPPKACREGCVSAKEVQDRFREMILSMQNTFSAPVGKSVACANAVYDAYTAYGEAIAEFKSALEKAGFALEG